MEKPLHKKRTSSLSILNRVSYSWYMERFFNSIFQHNSRIPLLKNHPIKEKRIILTVEHLCQQLLNKCVSNFWTIVLVTVEQLCKQILFSHTSDH